MPGRLQWFEKTSVIRLFLFAVALTGAILAYRNAYSMIAYSLPYFDIGNAIFQGKWDVAVNSMWSPLFPVFLGILNNVFKPSITAEYPAAVAMNFVIYLLGLLSLEFSLRNIFKLAPEKENKGTRLHQTVIWISAALVYMTTCVSSRVFPEITPDLMVANLVFIMVGVLARMIKNPASWANYFLFGFLIGTGFLLKAIMFPLGAVMFVAMAYGATRARRFDAAMAVKFLIVLLISGGLGMPYLVALHAKYGRWTTGDSSSLVYLWEINHAVPGYGGGVEAPPENGKFLHPIRLVSLDREFTFREFAEPVGGTFPPFFDPGYWHEGVHSVYKLKDILEAWGRNVGDLELYIVMYAVFAGLGLVLLYDSERKMVAGNLWRNAAVLFPPVAGLGAYAILAFDSPRYFVSFAALIFAIFLNSLRFKKEKIERANYGAAVAAVIASVSIVFTGITSREEQPSRLGRGASNLAVKMAEYGVKPGDKIAAVVYKVVDTAVFAAHLTRSKIIAQASNAPFALYPPEKQRAIIELARKIGANWLIVQVPMPMTNPERRFVFDTFPDNSAWKRLGNSPAVPKGQDLYFLYSL